MPAKKAKKQATTKKATKRKAQKKSAQKKSAKKKDPIRGRRFAIFGKFARWPGYLGSDDPAELIERRGGTVVRDPKQVDEQLDVLVLGDKRGKGRTEAERRGQALVAAGGKLEIQGEQGFLHMFRVDISGKRFCFAGAFDFCFGGLEESQPPALVQALGAHPVAEVSEQLDYLVVGQRRGKGKTALVRKAKELRAAGASLEVIDEAGFLELIQAEAKPASSGGAAMDFGNFLVRLQSLADPRRIKRALKMLKAEAFQLYVDVLDERVTGVIRSQTSSRTVYSNVLTHEGRYCCCDEELHECMGLQGKVCKHLLVLVIGLTRTGALDANRAVEWLRLAQRKRPDALSKQEDTLANTLLRYKGAQAGEVDWRPMETLPEDFMAF